MTTVPPAWTVVLQRASTRVRAMGFRAAGAFGAELIAALTVFAVAFDVPHNARVTFAVALFFWAPGHCVAVLAAISDPLLFGVVTVAMSIGVCLLVSLALFYMSVWQGSTALIAVTLITAALAAGALWREGVV